MEDGTAPSDDKEGIMRLTVFEINDVQYAALDTTVSFDCSACGRTILRRGYVIGFLINSSDTWAIADQFVVCPKCKRTIQTLSIYETLQKAKERAFRFIDDLESAQKDKTMANRPAEELFDVLSVPAFDLTPTRPIVHRPPLNS